MFTDTCIDIVYETLERWAASEGKFTYYGDDELHLHKQMWDILTRHKDGTPKEHDFIAACRRIANHRAYPEIAAARITATELDEKTASFRSLALDMLTNDLTQD